MSANPVDAIGSTRDGWLPAASPYESASTLRFPHDARPSLPVEGFAEPPEWTVFLASLTAPAVGLSERQATRLRELWRNLRVALGPRLPLPQVEPGDDGAIKLCWSRPTYYAEIELDAEDAVGRVPHRWFFRDRVRDTHAASSEAELGTPGLPLLSRLRVAIGG